MVRMFQLLTQPITKTYRTATSHNRSATFLTKIPQLAEKRGVLNSRSYNFLIDEEN